MKEVKTDLSYQTGTKDTCLLSITIGDAQVGHTTFKKINGTYGTGQIQMEDLGKETDLKGKKMLISTIVTDVNPATNKTSISYKINDKAYDPILSEADAENGSLRYKTIVTFS